jgi:hypothetical protein
MNGYSGILETIDLEIMRISGRWMSVEIIHQEAPSLMYSQERVAQKGEQLQKSGSWEQEGGDWFLKSSTVDIVD